MVVIKMKKGEKIAFGKYVWRILDVDEDRVLIITEDIIEKRSYHHKYEEITWEACSLRSYLNSEFLDQFSADEKARILLTTIQNQDNQWYGTDAGVATYDYIFLLDIEEVVCKYFGDSRHHLQNRRPSEKYWFGKKDENNSKRIARHKGEDWGSWWWLRTPGKNNKDAVYVHGDGNVGINGNSVFFRRFGPERDGGIRPALWLKHVD